MSPETAKAVSAPAEKAVELRDVRLAYGPHVILDGISFAVRRGEIFCVLGGSGVGKSTILKLILRLARPDSGQVVVLDHDLAAAGRGELFEIRRHLGMVFQGSALFDSLPVSDNVAFALVEHTDLPMEAIRDRVSEALDFVDLDVNRVGELLPSELSGGMRKRVGIARAIVHQPDICLFDEPTSGLDPITTRTIDDLIVKLRVELGLSSVVVTHDTRSALRIGDRVALLRSGRIVFIGTPREMIASGDRYVREFMD